MIAIEVVWALLKRWWPQIVGALLVVGVVAAILWWDHGRLEAARDEGRAEVLVELNALQTEFDTYKERQQQMVTALALKWSEAVQRVEVRYVEAATKQARVFSWFKRRVQDHKPATDAVVVRVPAGALGLLNDAHAAANDPRPAASREVPAETVPAPTGDGASTTLTDWIIFGVDAAEAYADARQKWAACVEFVEGIRRGTIPQQTAPSPQTEEAK